jgi:hypothetical protein
MGLLAGDRAPLLLSAFLLGGMLTEKLGFIEDD